MTMMFNNYGPHLLVCCLVLIIFVTSLKSSSGFNIIHNSCLSSSTKLQLRQRVSSTLFLGESAADDDDDDNDDVNTVTTRTMSRRDLLSRAATTAATVAVVSITTPFSAFAFDGSGASVSAGYSPATKSEKKKKFKQRIIADVKDFIVLGQAIDKGETKGPAWANFFITFQRREPDEAGRTYAALVDLRGLPTKKSHEFEGGDGLLLAKTFTKPGKPPDNTPAVKSFVKLSKTFDAIEAAGNADDISKANKAWLKTSELLSQYLSDVELPGDIKDPIYQP
jgi:hypothetical protein